MVQGGRAILFEQAHLRAVITLHRHTFQPRGVKTCLLVAEEKMWPHASPGCAHLLWPCLVVPGQD